MEMSLITDTYLPSVPFGGRVIKANNDGPCSGKSKQDQRKRSSEEKVQYSELGLAVGNRGLIKVPLC